MRRHHLIALPPSPWRGIAEGLRPGVTWVSVARLAELVPRHGDVVAGFFSLAETALMQRFGLRVLTFSSEGAVLPSAERALRPPAVVEFVEVPPVMRLRTEGPSFSAGPEALARAAALRARRAAQARWAPTAGAGA